MKTSTYDDLESVQIRVQIGENSGTKEFLRTPKNSDMIAAPILFFDTELPPVSEELPVRIKPADLATYGYTKPGKGEGQVKYASKTSYRNERKGCGDYVTQTKDNGLCDRCSK